MATNTGIASSLLSRFDLVFVILDEHDPKEDVLRANHVLNIVRNIKTYF